MPRLLSLMIAIFFLVAEVKPQSLSSTARTFVASLDASQKPMTLFAYDSDERYNFHYFPIDDRKGLPLDKMTAEQKKTVMSLLSSCLTDNTVKKINDIIELENILKVLENRKPDDPFRTTWARSNAASTPWC